MNINNIPTLGPSLIIGCILTVSALVGCKESTPSDKYSTVVEFYTTLICLN